jgi:predicted porin
MAFGAKYRFTPALQIGVGYEHGNNGNGTASATALEWSNSAWIVGVGYQATPSLLLGVNYAVTAQDSSMYNLQARYSLSKRTMVYAQGTAAVNGNGYAQIGGNPVGNLSPVSTNSVVVPAANIAGISGVAGATGYGNTTQTAVGVGVIHNF